MWWGRLVMIGAAATAVSAARATELETVIVRPSCVKEGGDGQHRLSYDCLNAELNAAAEDTPHVPTLKAGDAAGNGAPTKAGTFSFTATSIRMGANFGKSATPQRPQPPSYASPLLAGGK